jgi:hypothetical protein
MLSSHRWRGVVEKQAEDTGPCDLNESINGRRTVNTVEAPLQVLLHAAQFKAAYVSSVVPLEFINREVHSSPFI